ncbi:D-aminoacyl-tRNA deacylase 1 isoform X1 [Dasypus novemcinctus]|uniref:D-aminoacyl-tRNA deacylase 1 isoform X1 n=1 Tax=Dasypus novemcinctus TaxID=9361 RepID=UPI0039C9D36B
MKAVVQRVTRASVTVGGEQISAIGRGICVLLGISLEDTQKELEHMVRKILNLRVFEDENGKHWSKSVMDKQYEVLCVSQFTLQCVLKGNKPDFHLAMPSDQAEGFYNSFLEQLRKAYSPELVKDGKFGTYMQVHIQNDGPVTIELESPAASTATSDPKQMRTETIRSCWPHFPHQRGSCQRPSIPSSCPATGQDRPAPEPGRRSAEQKCGALGSEVREHFTMATAEHRPERGSLSRP